MTSYTVYLPPEDVSENIEENFRLIPDTKATLALIFPPFWLAWHRLWLELLIYFCAIIAIILLAVFNPSVAVSYLSILPGFYLLLEGYQLVRNDLERNGWQYAGVVEGGNAEEAEIRFLINSVDLLEKPKAVIKPRNKPMLTNHVSNQNTTSLFPE